MAKIVVRILKKKAVNLDYTEKKAKNFTLFPIKKHKINFNKNP